MTIYAGHQLNVAISATIDTPSYANLKGMRECNWRIDHVMQEIPAIVEDAWLRLSDITQRVLRVNCTVYGASHTAQARVRVAALEAETIKVKLTLADGTLLESSMLVERYEENARENDVLEVTLNLISSGQVSITE